MHFRTSFFYPVEHWPSLSLSRDCGVWVVKLHTYYTHCMSDYKPEVVVHGNMGACIYLWIRVPIGTVYPDFMAVRYISIKGLYVKMTMVK